MEIEDDAKYRIRMKRAIKHEHEWLRPSTSRIVVRGSVLKQIKDDVLDYQKVD